MKKPAVHNIAEAAVLLMRAKAALQRKQHDVALADVAESLRLNPLRGEALMIRVIALVELGRYSEALAAVEQRLQLQPPDPVALLTRGNLHAHLNDLDSAVADFTEFLRQQPETVVALRARALSYSRLRRFDEALADLQEALRIEPGCADTYEERGRIYQHSGRYALASADYQKALELDANEGAFYNQYAWMLSACPDQQLRDGARAVKLARRGCELMNWKDANLLDTLACAHAECGQFDEALKWGEKSLESAPDEIKEAVQRHVESFRQRQPVRFEEGKEPGAATPP